MNKPYRFSHDERPESTEQNPIQLIPSSKSAHPPGPAHALSAGIQPSGSRTGKFRTDLHNQGLTTRASTDPTKPEGCQIGTDKEGFEPLDDPARESEFEPWGTENRCTDRMVSSDPVDEYPPGPGGDGWPEVGSPGILCGGWKLHLLQSARGAKAKDRHE